MGCGCGGSARSAERVPREKSGSTTPKAAARPSAGGDDGFVWRGPRRAAPAPVPASPRQ